LNVISRLTHAGLLVSERLSIEYMYMKFISSLTRVDLLCLNKKIIIGHVHINNVHRLYSINLSL